MMYVIVLCLMFLISPLQAKTIDEQKYGFVYQDMQTNNSWYYDKKTVTNESNGLVTVSGISVLISENTLLLLETVKKLNCKTGYGQTSKYDVTEFHKINNEWVEINKLPSDKSPIVFLLGENSPKILKEFWLKFCDEFV